jgi:hypothetical protein
MQRKAHEYERRTIPSLEKQCQSTLDALFSARSGTNIQKQFYKKKDFFDVPEPEEPGVDVTTELHNEELVVHKS